MIASVLSIKRDYPIKGLYFCEIQSSDWLISFPKIEINYLINKKHMHVSYNIVFSEKITHIAAKFYAFLLPIIPNSIHRLI